MQGGEMFNFLKFAVFFKQMTRGGVHLIYQRNLEFNIPTQVGTFEMALFKQELFEFEQLQIYMKNRVRNSDIGINWL